MIRFKMAKINVSQFAILADNVPDDGLSYSVNLGFKAATNAKRIGCEFSVEFMHIKKPILKLGIFCEYDIFPEDWDERIEKKHLTIKKEELGYFANQTVGVSRGVMFCKTEGTPFNQFIIPPINLNSLLNNDFVIEITQE